jgi:hypothetical protein
MGPNFFWKNYRLLIASLISLLFICNGYGQNKNKLALSYKIDSIKVGTSYNYNLEIMVDNANGPFTFYLCDKEPWLGGKILEQGSNVYSSSFTFSIQYSPNNLVIMAKSSTEDQYNWKTISTKRK